MLDDVRTGGDNVLVEVGTNVFQKIHLLHSINETQAKFVTNHLSNTCDVKLIIKAKEVKKKVTTKYHSTNKRILYLEN